MEGNEEGDWLAIFPKEKPSAGEFIVDAENDNGWIFTGGSKSGKVTFSTLNLSKLAKGEYEVRAFFNDSYKVEAVYAFFIKDK
jgi:hypothetical protein